MPKIAVTLLALMLTTPCSWAQTSNPQALIEHHVIAEKVTFKAREAIRVIEAEISPEEDKIAILPAAKFENGSISGYVAGGLRKEAGRQARGFVGIAFRIDEDVSTFEAIYLRPTNARAKDQLRRNHSMQYISFPDYPWHRLRKESPGKYESYADMQPGEWIHDRLEIDGTTAQLFLNRAEQPALIINDLKLGSRPGRVGLWVGPGTEAHFSDISVTPR